MARGQNQHGHESGTALVELAVILPLLIVILLGVVEFSRAWNAKATLTHATREGVRVLSVSGDQDAAEDAAVAASTPLDTDLLEVSSTACVQGDPTSVSASYPFSYSILFFGSGTITLESTTVMRCGG